MYKRQFLEQVAAGVDQLVAEKADVEKKLYILAQKVEEYRAEEDTLKSALDVYKRQIYAVLSREFAKNLMQVSYRQGALAVQGYVTAPIACRGSRSMQFFYINGRQVEDRTLMAALETAYKGMAMQGRFPGCVLNLSLIHI